MPGQLSRVGDTTITGGRIITGAPTVLANGRPVGVLMSLVSPHAPAPKEKRHVCAKVITGSSNVFVEGKPVLRTGSFCTCGHTIIQGSLNIIVS